MMPATSFSLLIWLPAVRQGRPATARQADEVRIAIWSCTGNASAYHRLSRFLPFTGAIVDIRNLKLNQPLSSSRPYFQIFKSFILILEYKTALILKSYFSDLLKSCLYILSFCY
jgi:hypothetical protein